MVISIRENSDTPIYIQLRDQIVIGISEGKLPPGERLPTVRALAEELGINAMTVNKAYQLLRQEGYIATERRNGARVREHFGGAPELTRESLEQLRRVISEARVRGMSKAEFFAQCERFFSEEAET